MKFCNNPDVLKETELHFMRGYPLKVQGLVTAEDFEHTNLNRIAVTNYFKSDSFADAACSVVNGQSCQTLKYYNSADLLLHIKLVN